MGWQWHGHGEKVRWTVYGAIDGQRVAFEHQKFGFTVFLPKNNWISDRASKANCAGPFASSKPI